MRAFFLLMLVSVVFIGCDKKHEKAKVAAKTETCSATKTKSGSKFKMYELSEMSLLMEKMYTDNQRLKQRIKNGDTIGKFPNHFLQIHKAVMTDQQENDAFFKAQANLFINSQELIYEDPKNAKAHFNDGVNACVACHEVKCQGPITRIKKLYID